MNNSTSINIGKLIERIGPINNKIRSTDGYERIALMWDVGDMLFAEGVTKIHPVAWEIQKKSYITRALVTYCYRIRRKWTTKAELENLFRGVRSYAAFREAMPLIENERFILDDQKVKNIIRWLNEENPRGVKSKLVAMKKEYINIRNDRRQRIDETRTEAFTFSAFYKYLTIMVKNEDTTELENIMSKVGDDGLLKLSQMCIAIMNDDYKGPDSVITEKMPDIFREFVDKLLPISLAKKEVKARFKRLVSGQNVMEIADILNSLRLGESLFNMKKRLNLIIGSDK